MEDYSKEEYKQKIIEMVENMENEEYIAKIFHYILAKYRRDSEITFVNVNTKEKNPEQKPITLTVTIQEPEERPEPFNIPFYINKEGSRKDE